jgi:hypothetical protein
MQCRHAEALADGGLPSCMLACLCDRAAYIAVAIDAVAWLAARYGRLGHVCTIVHAGTHAAWGMSAPTSGWRAWCRRWWRTA